MMTLGQLPNARAAQAFIDYAKGLGIRCQIEPLPQGVAVMLVDLDFEAQAQAEFNHFLQHPYDAKYLQASWDNGDTRPKFDYGSGTLGLVQQFITGAGPLTLVTFFICVIVFAVMNLGFANPVFELLSFFNATASENYQQFWRVFTPSLMHFSVMHIAFNLLWWWYLGGKIENRLGTRPLLFLLLAAGTLPNIVQYFMTGPNFGGLSGVVYAIAGYTWLMGIRKPNCGIGLPQSYMGFMMVWLVLGFTDILGMPMANGAHIGGLLVGLAQALFDSRKTTK
ncbi:rhomboid family intramembrane serine protease GlpG [Shewanella aestuarii]|uniref:Rhomboid family intramembrane serine protease GlpG n=1 Tax=Shewanella aestuarii TaxID=1028752 RepID=A0A6G9QPE6_9GAMM|nr:rhomboid family intramembrane serine protease GlpG [Shewanella aestuarii]QIR16288.1 rhomboid family intramembrane serine protease GlpG [Shewanella aestuarii]